jgi:outer membrane protein assembly factor BamB
MQTIFFMRLNPMNAKHTLRNRALSFFLLTALLTACQVQNVEQTPVPARSIASSTLNLTEQWTIQPGRTGYSEFPPPLLIVDGKVITYFFTHPGNPQSWLAAISLDTGEVLWKASINGSGIQFFHDDERLYLVDDFRLHAYRISDGEHLWQSEHLPSHTGYSFQAWDPPNPLRLYSSSDRVYSIDPLNGEILAKQAYPFFVQYAGYDFAYDNAQSKAKLIVMDRANSQVLWERYTSPLGISWLQPGFAGDDMLFLDGNVYYELNRVNLQTGATIWNSPGKYVSNYAMADSRLYALREDGVLIVLDVDTGEEIGQIVFEPSTLGDPGGYGYWVAAGEGYVVISFDDTQQLTAFKVSP